MRKNGMAILIMAVLLGLHSCKAKTKQADQTDQTTQTTVSQPASVSPPATKVSSEPKTYTVSVTPDTVQVGKNKEALVKIKNIKAVELSNPDGQITGIELTYDLEVTNKNSIGGSSVFISPGDFRLELDNGTKLTHDNYKSVSVQPEATASSSGNIFKLPTGAKPTGLNIFYDQTRATVKLEMK